MTENIRNVYNLFKKFQSSLMIANFYYNGKLISFDMMLEKYIRYRNKKKGLLTKITCDHINLQRLKKRNVKLSVQVLSASMASVIKTCDKIQD